MLITSVNNKAGCFRAGPAAQGQHQGVSVMPCRMVTRRLRQHRTVCPHMAVCQTGKKGKGQSPPPRHVFTWERDNIPRSPPAAFSSPLTGQNCAPGPHARPCQRQTVFLLPQMIYISQDASLGLCEGQHPLSILLPQPEPN